MSPGLTQFGVNLTRLKPGAASALRHWHEQEDEFVYVLEGELVLIEDGGETLLKPGDCAGFKAGVANGHHLVNKSQRDARLSRDRHARGDRARALSRCRSGHGAGRRAACAFCTGRASRIRRSPEPWHYVQFQARHRRRRHRARHLGHARPLDERHRPQGHRGARRHRRAGRGRRRDQGRGHHLRQGDVLRRRRPHHAGNLQPRVRRHRRRRRARRWRDHAALRGEPQALAALPAARNLAASRGSRRSTARRSAAASSFASPAITASPPTIRRRASACPRSRSGCFPAPAARSASRA